LQGDARAGDPRPGGGDGRGELRPYAGLGRRLAHGTPGSAADEQAPSARRPDTPSAPAVPGVLGGREIRNSTPPSPPTPWSADSSGLLWSADDVVSAASTPENHFSQGQAMYLSPPDDPSSWTRDHLVPQHPAMPARCCAGAWCAPRRLPAALQ
jgi:hypothetical protein